MNLSINPEKFQKLYLRELVEPVDILDRVHHGQLTALKHEY